ncbi:MAG TPA: BlaI/MecI/CopY family transcriptional regulator [Gemmataceae bacterium]|nr:BlaI/MecI/CopY family transcriptional regulator [Gemmataceae bacterium]
MAKLSDLSKGEMEVARVIWELGEATLGEIFAAYHKDREGDYSTVQTYVRRLEAKGYVRSRRDGRGKRYRPKVAPSQVIRRTLEDLANRLTGGDAMPLVRHLIEDRGISRRDIAELRDLLNRLEEEGHDKQ